MLSNLDNIDNIEKLVVILQKVTRKYLELKNTPEKEIEAIISKIESSSLKSASQSLKQAIEEFRQKSRTKKIQTTEESITFWIIATGIISGMSVISILAYWILNKRNKKQKNGTK